MAYDARIHRLPDGWRCDSLRSGSVITSPMHEGVAAFTILVTACSVLQVGPAPSAAEYCAALRVAYQEQARLLRAEGEAQPRRAHDRPQGAPERDNA